MKTLTEIAQEAWQAADEAGAQDGEIWEAMCKAVRAAVIEECAEACEAVGRERIAIIATIAAEDCADAIRALKDKP